MIRIARQMPQNLTVSINSFKNCTQFVFCITYCCFILGESDHNASLSEDDGKVYDSDDLDEEVEKLKTSDPEFYKYLKECDKNLEKMSQSNDDDGVGDSDEDNDYDEDDVEGIKSEKLHKPPVNLEVSTL